MRPTLSRRDAALWRTIGLAVVVGLVTGALVVLVLTVLLAPLTVRQGLTDTLRDR